MRIEREKVLRDLVFVTALQSRCLQVVLTVLKDYKPDLGRGSTRVMRAKHIGLV